jgi:diadenosine tetraphosphatase ApaH/serine/threonine PP2A family protein phosphatase
MRYLILSDLHANLQALDAVLEDAQAIGYDAVLVLGDLVGYGADPQAVIDRTLALEPVAMIRGNHDKVCAGLESPLLFNDAARASAEWTAGVLDAHYINILRDLPKGPRLVTDAIEICHGTPFDEDHYVFDDQDASRAADAASARVCLFGHTHVPAIYATAQEPVTAFDGVEDELRLPRQAPVLINVGSVGQPRDGDPRAAYGVLDDERGSIRLRRVAYDILGAQASILKAQLPEWLALRLERGQ